MFELFLPLLPSLFDPSMGKYEAWSRSLGKLPRNAQAVQSRLSGNLIRINLNIFKASLKINNNKKRMISSTKNIHRDF